MRITKRLTGAVVAASVLLSVGGVSAAHAATPAAESPIVSASAQEDGRAIAEAILFGSGEQAAAVATIPALALAQEVVEGNESAEAQEVITAVLDAIEDSDPGIYDAVHAGLRSGDPYAVESAVTRLSDSAHAVVADDSESGVSAQLASDVTPNSLVAVIALAVHVVTIVTAANAAIFVNAVGGANVFWTENWGPSSAQGERPTELIGDLAEAFSE